MNFLSELKQFFTAIVDWLVLLVIFGFFFFGFNVGEVSLFNRVFVFVLPTTDSFAVEVFRMMVHDLSPSSVPLIVTSPLTAFVSQVKIAFLLSFLATFPVLCYRIIRFIAPALYTRERILLYLVTIPATLLFIGGIAFSYAYVVPTTFSVLYMYAQPIGAVTYLTIDAFLGLSIALMIIAGITATIPVIMVLLTTLNIVSAAFWTQKWRYAVISLFIVSAIITPDGSGISMALLSVPGVILYGLGTFVSVRVERVRHNRTAAVVGQFSK